VIRWCANPNRAAPRTATRGAI